MRSRHIMKLVVIPLSMAERLCVHLLRMVAMNIARVRLGIVLKGGGSVACRRILAV